MYPTPTSRDPVYDEFSRHLALCTVKPDWDGGRNFIQVQKFTTWMRNRPHGSKATNTDRLLNAVYINRILPIHGSKISEAGDDCCVLVFSILLEIGLGHVVNEVQKSLVDTDLPCPLDELKDIFQPISPTNHFQYADLFNNVQWKFKPMKFRWDMEKVYPEEHIIPFCRRKEIGQGGQGRVWAIVVQDEYVCEKLHEKLGQGEPTRYCDPEYGECFTLALKTYDEGNIRFYKEEKSAFDGIKNKKGIIRYLGTYGHKEKRTMTDANSPSDPRTIITRHILLEYGEFSLMKIFVYRLPPVFEFEIQDFWASLIEIVDALKGIHKLKTNNGEWSGWYNDIKPGNIIIVDGTYELADPGFAKFKRKLQEENCIPTIVAEGGTRTYAAPEVYARRRDSKTHVTQSVDIWSVGCVLSMAATWLVLGYQGIHQFHEVRQKAIRALAQGRRSGDSRYDIGQGDFFHNGEELLPEIRQWHQGLRQAVRRTDHITIPLLDRIERYMLTLAKTRLPADALYAQLQQLMDQTEVEPIPAEMDALMKTLFVIDQDANSTPNWVAKERSAHHTDQNESNTSKPPVELLKTASRFEALSRVSGFVPGPPEATQKPSDSVQSVVYRPPPETPTNRFWRRSNG